MTNEDSTEPRTLHILTGDEVEIKNVIDALPFYVLMVDCDHKVVMANETLYTTFQLDPKDVVGAYCPKVIHGLDCPFLGCPVEKACELQESVEVELYDESQDSWMQSGAYMTNMVTVDNKQIFLHVVSDITEKKKADEELAALKAGLEETVAIRTRELEVANRELERQILERQRAEETIRQLAYFDGLTGLPNRANFSVLLATAMKSAHRHSRRFAIALLDLDGLKTVNDSMGHDAGDRLLHLVGKRLEGAMRAEDVAARMGGDEFLFIFSEIGDSGDVGLIGERLLEAFNEPFSVYGTNVVISASVGGAVYPDDGADEVTLIKQADLAMYEAKSAGGNRFFRIGEIAAS